MPRGKATDPELVAKVTAALLAGMEAADAAREFKLPRHTVYRMAQNLGPKLQQVATRKLDRIGDLLADLIEANTEGMKAIALQATDIEYIEKHSPTALSDLYTTLADTTVRLLEAAGDVGDAQDRAGT